MAEVAAALKAMLAGQVEAEVERVPLVQVLLPQEQAAQAVHHFLQPLLGQKID